MAFLLNFNNTSLYKINNLHVTLYPLIGIAVSYATVMIVLILLDDNRCHKLYAVNDNCKSQLSFVNHNYHVSIKLIEEEDRMLKNLHISI